MKKRVCLLLAVAMMLLVSISSFAAFEQDSKGWKYKFDDGTYAKNEWVWCLLSYDDDYAFCYYFDKNGYNIEEKTAPDGRKTDEDGRLVTDAGLALAWMGELSPINIKKGSFKIPAPWYHDSELIDGKKFYNIAVDSDETGYVLTFEIKGECPYDFFASEQNVKDFQDYLLEEYYSGKLTGGATEISGRKCYVGTLTNAKYEADSKPLNGVYVGIPNKDSLTVIYMCNEVASGYDLEDVFNDIVNSITLS